jgi:hypothetical protein
LLSLAVLAIGAGLGGCAPNGFIDYYAGETHPEVRTARVVVEPPIGARLIGRASFVSASGEGNRQALAAARKVGADYVSWSSDYERTTRADKIVSVDVPTTATTSYAETTRGKIKGGPQGHQRYYENTHGTATTYETRREYHPVTVIEHWYLYDARFFRREPVASGGDAQ